MEHLVAPGNIFPGCPRFRFEAIRVYIKHEEDIKAIVDTLGNHWKGVPMHFLMADICRPELLLELEGIGCPAAGLPPPGTTLLRCFLKWLSL